MVTNHHSRISVWEGGRARDCGWEIATLRVEAGEGGYKGKGKQTRAASPVRAWGRERRHIHWVCAVGYGHIVCPLHFYCPLRDLRICLKEPSWRIALVVLVFIHISSSLISSDM